MTDSLEFASDTEPVPEPEMAGEGWSGADIEEAYLKALNAMEDIPWEEGVTADGAAEQSVVPHAAESTLATDGTAPNGSSVGEVSITPDGIPDSSGGPS